MVWFVLVCWHMVGFVVSGDFKGKVTETIGYCEGSILVRSAIASKFLSKLRILWRPFSSAVAAWMASRGFSSKSSTIDCACVIVFISTFSSFTFGSLRKLAPCAAALCGLKSLQATVAEYPRKGPLLEFTQGIYLSREVRQLRLFE